MKLIKKLKEAFYNTIFVTISIIMKSFQKNYNRFINTKL